jgi:hypothetical protein
MAFNKTPVLFSDLNDNTESYYASDKLYTISPGFHLSSIYVNSILGEYSKGEEANRWIPTYAGYRNHFLDRRLLKLSLFKLDFSSFYLSSICFPLLLLV